MTDSLKLLFQAIAQTKNEQQLQKTVKNEIGVYFAAKRCGVFMLDSLPNLVKKSKLLELALSREYNPLLHYLIEHHAPIHEQVLLSETQWQTICPRLDHGHVMIGPIIDHTNLVGALGVTRDRNSQPFNSQDIADMSALSLHISTWLVKIEPQSIKLTISSKDLITPREQEIAELVAKGLTNAEIAQQIWITENSVKQALKRMFRKLNVSSRTEMVAKLTGIIPLE